MVRLDDIAGVHTHHLAAPVVQDLHAVVHPRQPRGINHVQANFVLEDLERAGGFVFVRAHAGDGAVEVVDRFDPGDTGQDGLGASAVAGVAVRLDAADGDAHVGLHEVPVDLDPVAARSPPQVCEVLEDVVVQPRVPVGRLAQLGRRLDLVDGAMRSIGRKEQDILVFDSAALALGDFGQAPGSDRLFNAPANLLRREHRAVVPGHLVNLHVPRRRNLKALFGVAVVLARGDRYPARSSLARPGSLPLCSPAPNRTCGERARSRAPQEVSSAEVFSHVMSSLARYRTTPAGSFQQARRTEFRL